MTIESSTNQMNYTGNGSTATYPYTFKVFSEDDLVVKVVKISDSTETTLTVDADYTVSNVGVTTGGNVVLVDDNQAWLDDSGFLSSSYDLVIRRVVDLIQDTSIRNQGPYYASIHEDTFDYLTMIDQQQQNEIDRSLKVVETVTGVDMTLPTPSAGLAIGWNATEDGLTNLASLGAVGVSSFMETVLDDTTASAARSTLGVYFPVTSLDFYNGGGGPVLQEVSSIASNVYTFQDSLSQDLYVYVRVPTLYVAGRQIFLKCLHYHVAASATQLISAQSTLYKVGEDVTGSVNQYSSTNSAQTGASGILCASSMDLTNSSGQINSVAVAAGDLIKVRVFRGSDSSSSDINVIKSSFEVSF